MNLRINKVLSSELNQSDSLRSSMCSTVEDICEGVEYLWEALGMLSSYMRWQLLLPLEMPNTCGEHL